MQTAYASVLLVHAVAGLCALAALPLPLIARKGSRLHRRAGWVFVAAMAGVALTGLVISTTWLLAPLTVQPRGDRSPAELAAIAAQIRGYGLFFNTIAVMSGAAVWQGIAALRRSRAQRPRRRRWDLGIAVAPILSGALLLILGLVRGEALFIGFGALASFGGVGDLRAVLRDARDPKSRILRHLQAMLGGATAALVAFCVLVLRRHLPQLASYDLLFWFVPAALGVFGTVAWTRVWRKRLG